MSGGAPRRAGVMGWPIGHSRSPALHGHWLTRHGVDGQYLRLAVRPADLAAALSGLRPLGFAGCSLTIPHKVAALTLMDAVTDTARLIGAVNTVVVQPNGGLRGDNTDGLGFLAALKEGAPAWRAASGPAVVLGAGGAARAVVVALLRDGVSDLRLANRSPVRAEELRGAFPADLAARIGIVPWNDRAACLDGATLLVNTTSLGMTGQPPLDLALDALPAAATVMDLVYAPLETPLLAAARARGLTAVDGLGMLLHQARPGFAAWFGIDPVVDEALRRAVLDDVR